MNYVVLLIVLLLGMMGQLALGLTVSILPQVEMIFDTPMDSVQLIMTVLLLGLAVAYLVFPLMTDSFGRKTPLLSGLFIGLLGTMLCLASKNLNWLLLGVFFQGLGVGSSDAVSKVVFRDLYKGINLATNVSYLAMVYLFILVVAPVIGSSLLYRFNFKGIYSVFAFVVIFSWWLSMRYLPETLADEKRLPFFHSVTTGFKQKFLSAPFWAYAVISGLGYACVIAWLTEAPRLLVKKLMFSPIEMSLTVLGIGIAFIFGSMVNIRLIKTVPLQRLLRFGLWLMFIASSLVFLAYIFLGLKLIALVAPISVFMFATSFVFSNAYSLALSKTPERFGLSSGLYHSIQVLIAVLASFAVILGAEETQLALAGVLVVSSALAVMVQSLFTYQGDISDDVAQI